MVPAEGVSVCSIESGSYVESCRGVRKSASEGIVRYCRLSIRERQRWSYACCTTMRRVVVRGMSFQMTAEGDRCRPPLSEIQSHLIPFP